jgi:hypothetical protein
MVRNGPAQAVITWITEAVGFVLESAPMLGNSFLWSPTTNQVHSHDNLRTVTNTISGPKEFYRLRRPVGEDGKARVAGAGARNSFRSL